MTDFTLTAQEHSFDAPQNKIPDWQPFPVGTNDSDFSTAPLLNMPFIAYQDIDFSASVTTITIM